MSWLSDLLKDYPSLSVAKERLKLLQDKMQLLEEENAKLKAENDALKKSNTDLQKQVIKNKAEENFIEDSGVLFKKKQDGNFEKYAYCPKCRQAMAEFPPRGGDMLVCAACTFTAPFHPKELNGIRNRVMQKYYKR